MPSRRPPWFVQREPSDIKYAFFISHVADDARDVRRLRQEIVTYSRRNGRPALECFLDIENWDIANDPMPVIHENLYASDFTVLWVTASYMKNPRGWVWVEFTLAELFERSFNLASGQIDRFPLVVPIFRDVTLKQIERTPLLRYWQRRLVAPGQRIGVQKIAQELVKFYEQEMVKRT